jgi:exonuclease III
MRYKSRCNRKLKLILGNIYRPAREIVENYENFINEIDEILSTKLSSYKEVVICGDFNFDLLKIQD